MALQQDKGSIFELASEKTSSTRWHTRLIGRPLATADAPHQTIGKLVGLAVFASDALSSSAYATQEILMVLVLAGAGAFHGGQNLFYLAVIAGTALILVLAANTAIADFPRLGALAASDGYLPRQLAYRGSQLVYSRGIVALSFTLSQTGMARRWWKSGQLTPQPGRFYGGWITKDVVGPFKGEPGTMDW